MVVVESAVVIIVYIMDPVWPQCLAANEPFYSRNTIENSDKKHLEGMNKYKHWRAVLQPSERKAVVRASLCPHQLVPV